jgi:hypothetical protein
MPSVIGLLEEREREAARRVEMLREEADRILARLQDAEQGWERFVISRETWERFAISRKTVIEGIAGPDHDDVAAGTDGPVTENPLPAPEPAPVPSRSEVVPRSVVPVWHEGREVSVLSADYHG